MPFGVVSEVSQGTGVLDGGGDHRKGKGNFGGKCVASHCNHTLSFIVNCAHSRCVYCGECAAATCVVTHTD